VAGSRQRECAETRREGDVVIDILLSVPQAPSWWGTPLGNSALTVTAPDGRDGCIFAR
jgi:hypothetical protein